MDPQLFEIRIGIYATDEQSANLREEGDRLLTDAGRGKNPDIPESHAQDELGRTSELTIHETPATPDSSPFAERYAELLEQWRIEHPNTATDQHRLREIRVGLYGSHARMDTLRDALTRLLCPDPEHSSPCPIPWSAGYTDESDETQEPYLTERYGQLRS